jgi:hypothetical protein
VDQTIKKLDVIYGDQATATCLVAAGIRPPPTSSRGSKNRAQPVGQPAPPSSGTDQQVETGAVSADSKAKVTVGKVEASSSSTRQKIKTGDLKASGDSQVEIGVVNQPASRSEQK